MSRRIAIAVFVAGVGAYCVISARSITELYHAVAVLSAEVERLQSPPAAIPAIPRRRNILI